MLTQFYEGFVCKKIDTRLCDLRISEHNKQGNTEIVIEHCTESRRRRRWKEDFFLISLTEHNLLLASLFIFPHRLHMHTPLLIWACTPTPPMFFSPFSFSLSLSHCLSILPVALLKRVTPLISQLCAVERERKTREVSLAVKNSPYAIWANRCKAECNKFQVWEITPRVWGGKNNICLFSSSPSHLLFLILFEFWLVIELMCAHSQPFCLFSLLVGLCSKQWHQYWSLM